MKFLFWEMRLRLTPKTRNIFLRGPRPPQPLKLNLLSERQGSQATAAVSHTAGTVGETRKGVAQTEWEGVQGCVEQKPFMQCSYTKRTKTYISLLPPHQNMTLDPEVTVGLNFTWHSSVPFMLSCGMACILSPWLSSESLISSSVKQH